jgi:hypothetical protein
MVTWVEPASRRVATNSLWITTDYKLAAAKNYYFLEYKLTTNPDFLSMNFVERSFDFDPKSKATHLRYGRERPGTVNMRSSSLLLASTATLASSRRVRFCSHYPLHRSAQFLKRYSLLSWRSAFWGFAAAARSLAPSVAFHSRD